jgi:hypothetical protein
MKCLAVAVQYVILSHIPNRSPFSIIIMCSKLPVFSFSLYNKTFDCTVDRERKDSACLFCHYLVSVIGVNRQVSSVERGELGSLLQLTALMFCLCLTQV